MSIILGERLSVIAEAPPPSWLGITWTGWDGSVWDLISGPVQLAPGVRGLGAPTVQRWADSSPGVDGSRWRGARTVEREVFWPLVVEVGDGQAALDTASEFMRTLDPDRPGLWTVAQPSGQTRTLVCRWASTQGADLDLSTQSGTPWFPDVYLVADDPFWSGPPISRTWGQAEPADFFGVGGPPFRVSPASTLATATMRNPGDVDAWPVWRVDGPTTGVDLGVDGGVVEVPFAVPGGSSLTIDTHPTRQVATLAGEDVTADLGEVQWRRIPAGGEVPLSLAMTGEGSVTVTVIPRFRSAW